MKPETVGRLVALLNVGLSASIPALVGWWVYAATEWTAWCVALGASFVVGLLAMGTGARSSSVEVIHGEDSERRERSRRELVQALAGVIGFAGIWLAWRNARTPGVVAGFFTTAPGAYLPPIALGLVSGWLTSYFFFVAFRTRDAMVQTPPDS